MDYLRSSILATIVYYDTLDYPLTLLEIYRNLINPARIVMTKTGIGEISINDVGEELKKLVASQVIGEKGGFYFLGSRDELYDVRIESQEISDQKWEKFLKFVKFLVLAPYLRGIFASGSLALGNTDKQSDLDVLVVAQARRLYTCRLFLWLISSLLGVRRKKHEKVAPDKLCFNHYVTDKSLQITHESLFNAQTYANLKPGVIKQELVDEFYNDNLWLNNYLYNFKPNTSTKDILQPSKLFITITSVFTLILNTRLGDLFESFVKKVQQNKIRNNPVTYEPGGRIVFTDDEIEFHPHSFEKVVIKKYKENLARLGIVPFVEEKDSGLN